MKALFSDLYDLLGRQVFHLVPKHELSNVKAENGVYSKEELATCLVLGLRTTSAKQLRYNICSPQPLVGRWK